MIIQLSDQKVDSGSNKKFRGGNSCAKELETSNKTRGRRLFQANVDQEFRADTDPLGNLPERMAFVQLSEHHGYKLIVGFILVAPNRRGQIRD